MLCALGGSAREKSLLRSSHPSHGGGPRPAASRRAAKRAEREGGKFLAIISWIGAVLITAGIVLLSGVFLIAFGIYLEKKRRKLLCQMKEAAP